MHSSLLVSCGTRIMIDCGADWLGQLSAISPDAIVITHAHPDHALGLKDGAPCPVYATAETWRALGRMPIDRRECVQPGTTFEIGPAAFEAVAVIHSAIAPAVGYRVTIDRESFFYSPDVLRIPGSIEVLSAVDLYIGDGARLEHPIVRGKGARASGHASIREQLSWCAEAKVRHSIFTHCGTPIINANSVSIGEALKALARPLAIEASFACDGDTISLGFR
jgi:phosphoribosyl 1,2-cyclic phosphodiesterase